MPMSSTVVAIGTALVACAALALAGCVQTTVRPVQGDGIDTATSDGQSNVVDLKIEKYEGLVRDFPEEPHYLERLARLHWMKKDHRTAIRYIDRARVLDPGNPRYDFLEGSIYFALGNYRAAESSFREVIANSPEGDFTGPYLQLARICLLQERSQEAITWLARCQELDPGLPVPHYYLGQFWLARGDEEKAIEHFERYLRLGSGPYQDEVLQTLERIQPNYRHHIIR